MLGDNLYINPRGHRLCHACRKDQRDKRRKTKEGRENRKFNRLYTLYRLRRENISEMLSKQNNCCALCGKPFEDQELGQGVRGLTWVVDHNHKTNIVRELIHRDCNVAIGLLMDDPELCRKAALYLEKHSAVYKQEATEVS